METEETPQPPSDEEALGQGLDDPAEREAQGEDPTAPDRGFEDIEHAQGERAQADD